MSTNTQPTADNTAGTEPTFADISAPFSAGLSFANNTIAQSVQAQNVIFQGRLAQQKRAAAALTAKYGAKSTQATKAQAAVNSYQTAITRIAVVRRQVATAPPQVTAAGWALYGHIYNAQSNPVSAYTVFLVDEQNAYQGDYGFVYSASDGSYQINYSGPAAGSSEQSDASAPPQLYLQIANDKAQPVYLSTSAFQPQTGAATYQDITLPKDEPVLGDPPAEIRAVAMPKTKKG